MTLQSCSENTGAPEHAGRFVTLNLTFLTPSALFTRPAFLGAFINHGPDPSVNATHATQLVKSLEDRGSAEMCWGGRSTPWGDSGTQALPASISATPAASSEASSGSPHLAHSEQEERGYGRLYERV